jgi:hypothetical protein
MVYPSLGISKMKIWLEGIMKRISAPVHRYPLLVLSYTLKFAKVKKERPSITPKR